MNGISTPETGYVHNKAMLLLCHSPETIHHLAFDKTGHLISLLLGTSQSSYFPLSSGKRLIGDCDSFEILRRLELDKGKRTFHYLGILYGS